MKRHLEDLVCLGFPPCDARCPCPRLARNRIRAAPHAASLWVTQSTTSWGSMSRRESSSRAACGASRRWTARAHVVPHFRTRARCGKGRTLAESQMFCLDLRPCVTLCASFLAWTAWARNHGLVRWIWSNCMRWSVVDPFCAVEFLEAESDM